MGTPNPRTWSELPPDLLGSIFHRLSFTDFHRAKIVCWNWNLSSKLTVPKKIRSPWLMLFPEGNNEDGSVLLFNPEEEEKIYKTKRYFSGIRFLANSGKWFLVIDSLFNLYIIDVFSENKIDLLPLEESLLDKEESEDLTGLLWSILDNTTIGSHRRFCIFKNIDYNPQEEVDSLGDEALLLNLGILLPSIAPNSIYFTRHGRIYHKEHFNLDLCVFNLETKTLKRFPSLANMKLKDAQWFFPGI
ncbi:unnamed protein product [Arabidopsis thaliana]|uniref:(thale cress) hypothetical protein n=1 Tax=Arabidopsis thaliana TaxID=3702 RepID=A0A7G2E8D1_ARATH|nr:unnamed protein product [Arabidopsis thaliana]